MNDKKEKIREIFAAISPERKNNVRRILSEKFNITVDSAKMNWIYGGKIPEQNIDKVLEILKNEAREQSNEILELIDAI
ncbi:hypothetical protein [Chryseobacterium daeguense]|uniref:hypothetical protein n=1 Tax=Chryseobacterium daeguense TaxID=412438 RepID=UPI000403470E|nr:hypothetical protein [Chryseobacterium daeguense]